MKNKTIEVTFDMGEGKSETGYAVYNHDTRTVTTLTQAEGERIFELHSSRVANEVACQQ